MKKLVKIKNNGITLIALVVTIVVLLILAGISIGALTGDHGIINQAKNGKDSTEISEEKEVIDLSVAQAINADVMGNLERSKLQEKLNSNAGDGVTEVIDSGNTLVVKFIEKDRYYEIDKDGHTEGPKELIKDSNAGDITKGNTLDGSEAKPFEINCIEDLVEFSILVNDGNCFTDQYVVLTRTLDFNSIFSYNDYTTIKYGDLNTDSIVEDIRTELTKKDDGCIGFTPIGKSAYSEIFRGTFDGKNNIIKNIYSNLQDRYGGLFGGAKNATIRNLTITGNINSTNYTTGGFCAEIMNTIIENCHNKAQIIENGKIDTHNPKTGGIVGMAYENCQIINCSNEGNVEGDSSTGGIVGAMAGKIINCYNSGDIKGKLGVTYGAVGGIAGYGEEIYNCFNVGEITSLNTSNYVYASAGGILGNSGQVGSNSIVINCYNIGKVNKATQGYGGIIGGYWYNNTNIATLINTFYQSDLGMLGYYNVLDASGVEEKTSKYMHSNELVLKLNDYIENNTDVIDTSKWEKWKLGENGYPVFQ